MINPSQPGIRRCVACGWKFVSPDVLRIWRCQDCKRQEGTYSPKALRNHQIHLPNKQSHARDTS